MAKQQQQLAFDWGQSALPKQHVPLSETTLAPVSATSPDKHTFDFKNTFPSPRRSAIDAGLFGPDEPDDAAVRSIHHEHGGELLAILASLDAVAEARRDGTDPRTGHAPRGTAGKEKLEQYLRSEPARLEARFETLLDVYQDAFGEDAKEQFEAFLRAQHQSSTVTPLRPADQEDATARTPQYDPGHPWHYLARGDGCEPIPVELIPAADYDGSFTGKLPRDPVKRRAKLEHLLAEESTHLSQFELNYQDLIRRGAEALGQYDRTIAYGGDDELGVASSLALRFNHIAHSRGRVRWLHSQLGTPLQFDAPTTASVSGERSAPVESGHAALALQGVQRPASAAGQFPAPPLHHAVAESPDASGMPGPDASPVGGSPSGEKTTNGGPMQTDIATTQPSTAARPSTTRAEKLEKLHDSVEQALDKLAGSLEAGHSDTLKAWLKTMSRFHNYSLNNQMLIAWQRPDATHVAGFHAWKKFDRLVNKGEKGIMILAPVTKIVGTRTELDRQGKSVEKPVRAIVNAKVVYVFDVSQTHGEPLPELNVIKGDPSAFTPKLKDLILAKGIELYFAERLPMGALGVSEGGKIGVKQGLTAAEEFHVLTHELAHELLHRGERRKQTTKRSRELEAESVAFVVCNAVGLDAQASSTDYIQLYRGDKEMLLESLQFIRTVSVSILDALRDAPSTGTAVPEG